ncbi:MAG TPA: FtsX-like permease family protein [Acidobacteriaceae bacterium]|nr:FtsX-like permease family protein [Acidobacteriaceae bacterium]
MSLEFFVAARYLRAKRRQAVVGIVTAIAVLGVAAGVAALIIALAITNGMSRDLRDRLLSSTAHVQLMRVNDDGIRNWRVLDERLATLPGVKAAAPGLYEQVMVSRGARAGYALLEGIVPGKERQVSDLLSSVTLGSAAPLEPQPPEPQSEDSGRLAGLSNPNQSVPPILVGHDLAESLDAKVGSTVMVTSPQGELTPLGLIPKFQRFQVVGIFRSGFYQYDSSLAFIRLADAQRLFGEPDVVSVISFKVKDLYHADAIGREIEQTAGPGFLTTNWMEQNRELFRALRLEQIVTFIVIGLIVCVAALNIFNALTMMVMEKTRDIAVMMSFGVKPAQVRRIFLLQGFLIGAAGTLLGLILGFGLSWLGGHYRFIHLSADVYSIDYLPFAARWTDGVIVACVSLGVSLLATLYPSSSAARILPAEALRYE